MGENVIVILSGGLDSTVLLHHIKAQGFTPLALGFSYGQRHIKELKYAEYWARKLCADYKVITLDFLKDIASNSALVNELKQVPHGPYDVESQKITVVPNRNMVMLSIAVAWAENLGIKKVFYGAHKNDYAVYPDCRPEFVESVSNTATLATYNKVQVIAPFVDMYKWQIARLGHELGVDFTMTWSCYEGGEYHCGRCGTCKERREAFAGAGIPDPTIYAE